MVSYIETIYPPAFKAEYGLMIWEYWFCEVFVGGVLCRDIAAQRCYEETI